MGKSNLITAFITPDNDPKFTAERRAAILDAISHHIPTRYAAEANGISEIRLLEWLEHGYADLVSETESDYTKFLNDFRRAEMQCIRANTDLIYARAENWQAHAWLLERRWPSIYAI